MPEVNQKEAFLELQRRGAFEGKDPAIIAELSKRLNISETPPVTGVSGAAQATPVAQAAAVPNPQGGTNKVGGFAVGLVDAFNPLPIINTAETAIREAPNKSFKMGPPQGIGGNRMGFSMYRSESPEEQERIHQQALSESKIPELTLKHGIESFGGQFGKDFVANLHPGAETAGMATGLIASLLEGGANLAGKTETGAKLLGKILDRPGLRFLMNPEVKAAAAGGKAAKAEEKFLQTTSEILGEKDVNKIKDLQQNVGRIEELYKEGMSGNSAGFEVAKKVRAELKNIQDKLGTAVGEFRDKVKADKTTQVPIAGVKQKAQALLNEAALSTGETTLSGVEKTDVDNVIKMLGESDARNPSDILKITDRIDGMTRGARVAKDNISNEAVYVLKGIRKELKQSLYDQPQFAGYDKVDAPYAAFKDHVEDIEGKIKGINGEGYVKSMFNTNKTEARDDLEKALAMASGQSIAPEVFKEIKSINTAGTLVGMGDVKLDQANRTFQKYRDLALESAKKRGGAIGGAIGIGLGGGTFGPIGATGAGGTGYVLGSRFLKDMMEGRAIRYGQFMADPQRIFDTAKSASQLSKHARQLAADLDQVRALGPQKGQEMLQMAIQTPAYKELANYIANSQQGEQ